jgi:hypothetical protein
VLDARFLRELREALALLLLFFHPRFPRVLEGEGSPRAGERSLDRRRIVEVSLHDFRAAGDQRAGFFSFRLARHRPHAMTFPQELVGRRSSLLAGRARDQDDRLFRGHRVILGFC